MIHKARRLIKQGSNKRTVGYSVKDSGGGDTYQIEEVGLRVIDSSQIIKARQVLRLPSVAMPLANRRRVEHRAIDRITLSSSVATTWRP